MDLLQLDEFTRATSECSGLAAKTVDLDRKASLRDLAWSYQNLAANLKMSTDMDMAVAERIILDAARASLLEATDDSAALLSEGPLAISGSFLARKRV
jgi:hypothetical protein